MAGSESPRPAGPVHAAGDAVRPPLPRWTYAIVNPVMGAILRSPLHRTLSGALLLLGFQGIESGKQYTIPVGYIQEGEHLYIFCHAGWWRNLPGQPVTVRLRGQERRGTARRLEERREIAALVQKVLARRGDAMARRMGLFEYADPEATGSLPQRTKFFDITLDAPAD